MEISDAFRIKIGLVFSELANVGTFLREHGHYERAIRVFLLLSKGDDTFEAGSYAYELGLCYEKMRDRSNAERYFTIAARENPSIPEYNEALSRMKSAPEK